MKKIIALAMVCASLLPAVARAEGHEGGHTEGHAEGHAENYVGVAISRLNANPSSTGAAVMLGHRYTEHLAVEVAYADSGMLKEIAERTTVLSAAVIGIVPITEVFEAYGRLGYASATTKDAAAGISASRSDLTYGVGVEYRLNAHYSVGLGWDRVRVGDNVDILRANEDAYALTVVRSF
ncbi:MAG: outer membrane beta-barrel protein [Nitrosomonadales bacterium]|nr:outer membrane beta-barrel protein [Nitrosomonadales bacterium]